MISLVTTFYSLHAPDAARRSENFTRNLEPVTLIVVILCAAIAVFLVALGVIVFIRSRNVKRTKIPLPSNLEQLSQNPIFEQSSNDYVNPKLEKWELPRNSIEFIRNLVDGKIEMFQLLTSSQDCCNKLHISFWST